MKKNIFPLVLMVFCFIPSMVHAQSITVAAAANLQYTLEELKGAFEQEFGLKVETIIGSSGKLTAQIENGAPFDIFLSADMQYPEILFKEGFSLGEPKIYARGTLVLWTMKKIDLTKGMWALTETGKKNVKRTIVVANPQIAPYGRQAINAMKYYNLYPSVEKQLVYGESIGQVNQFISSQAADLGFTAKSTVMAPSMKKKGTWVEISPTAYNPIEQGVVILKNAGKNDLTAVQKFYDFLFSAKAKEIFREYGYLVDE